MTEYSKVNFNFYKTENTQSFAVLCSSHGYKEFRFLGCALPDVISEKVELLFFRFRLTSNFMISTDSSHDIC